MASEHEVKVGTWIDLHLAGGIIDYFRGNELGVMLHQWYFSVNSYGVLIDASSCTTWCQIRPMSSNHAQIGRFLTRFDHWSTKGGH